MFYCNIWIIWFVINFWQKAKYRVRKRILQPVGISGWKCHRIFLYLWVLIMYCPFCPCQATGEKNRVNVMNQKYFIKTEACWSSTARIIKDVAAPFNTLLLQGMRDLFFAIWSKDLRTIVIAKFNDRNRKNAIFLAIFEQTILLSIFQ